MTINVFLDCEFTNFDQPKLISIALVTEDSKLSFYAELTDTYTREDCSDFVIETVLPLLDAKDLSLPDNGGYSHVHAKITFAQCSEYLKRWIDYLDDKVVIFNDAPHYDFTILTEVLYDNWPAQLRKKCHQITSKTIEGQKRYEKATEEGFDNGYRQHYALDDAKVMILAYKAMNRRNSTKFY